MGTLIDREELLDELDGDLEFLAENLELLESDGRALLEALRAASQSADQEAVVQKAHALKGMVANFCAPAVQAEAEAIEHQARAGVLDGITLKVSAFAATFDRLCAETRTIAAGDAS